MCGNCGGRVTGDGSKSHCEGCGLKWDASDYERTGRVRVSAGWDSANDRGRESGHSTDRNRGDAWGTLFG
jgi:hypothetical protein